MPGRTRRRRSIAPWRRWRVTRERRSTASSRRGWPARALRCWPASTRSAACDRVLPTSGCRTRRGGRSIFAWMPKERQFERAAVLSYGLQLDAFADDGVVTPGQAVGVDLRAANHGSVDVVIRSYSLSGSRARCDLRRRTRARRRGRDVRRGGRPDSGRRQADRHPLEPRGGSGPLRPRSRRAIRPPVSADPVPRHLRGGTSTARASPSNGPSATATSMTSSRARSGWMCRWCRVWRSR